MKNNSPWSPDHAIRHDHPSLSLLAGRRQNLFQPVEISPALSLSTLTFYLLYSLAATKRSQNQTRHKDNQHTHTACLWFAFQYRTH